MKQWTMKLKSLMTTILFLTTLTISSYALEMGLNLKAAPYGQQVFINTEQGWTYEQDTFGFGLYMKLQDLFVKSRLILGSNEIGDRIGLSGVVAEVGLNDKHDIMNITYQFSKYWGNTYLAPQHMMSLYPSHRVTVELKIPILGGKINDSYNKNYE